MTIFNDFKSHENTFFNPGWRILYARDLWRFSWRVRTNTATFKLPERLSGTLSLDPQACPPFLIKPGGCSAIRSSFGNSRRALSVCSNVVSCEVALGWIDPFFGKFFLHMRHDEGGATKGPQEL